MDTQVKQGPGMFQWNLGGWFGAQVGMSLWIALLGVALLFASRPVGAWLIVLALVANGLGVLLWRRRDRLEPYPALQILLGIGGAAAVIAFLAVARAGIPSYESGLPTPWFLLMYPGLMAVFHQRERTARRALSEQSDTP